MDELEFVRRTLVKMLVEEKEKSEQKNTSLINQLSKTIADNSKALSYIGMASPMLNKISNLVTIKHSTEKDKANEEIERIKKLAKENAESGFYLEMDNENDSIKCNESQRVF